MKRRLHAVPAHTLGEVRHLVSFWDWVRGAGKGSRFAYHVGSSETGPTAVKGAAYEAYRAGLVTLVQVNVSSAEDGHHRRYRYTAVRTAARWVDAINKLAA